ncbi:MAG: TlpA family protein disulfide reductase [Betaproteobacteria bacterium]|nr:TlpA family protein disulfide reductase [Betaproteobacteria bacterium]
MLVASAVGVYLETSGGGAFPVAGPQKGVGWAKTPEPVPDIRFVDGNGAPRALSNFRGKVVLLNVWATWCAPCRKEMPALDRLQRTLGGADFEVVALSIDNGGAAAARQFYDEIGIRSLAVYVDASMEATGKLRALGIPTTLLLDREGRERWRKTGPAEWDSPEIIESLRARLRASAS